jgi:hypothetical protein
MSNPLSDHPQALHQHKRQFINRREVTQPQERDITTPPASYSAIHTPLPLCEEDCRSSTYAPSHNPTPGYRCQRIQPPIINLCHPPTYYAHRDYLYNLHNKGTNRFLVLKIYNVSQLSWWSKRTYQSAPDSLSIQDGQYISQSLNTTTLYSARPVDHHPGYQSGNSVKLLRYWHRYHPEHIQPSTTSVLKAGKRNTVKICLCQRSNSTSI